MPTDIMSDHETCLERWPRVLAERNEGFIQMTQFTSGDRAKSTCAFQSRSWPR